jgi:hypothetical protein
MTELEAGGIRTEKPQPELPKYGTNELLVYRIWSREDKATFGLLAPFDPNMRPKHWFDAAAVEIAKADPEREMEYRVIRTGDDQIPRDVLIHMPAWEAALINLPGKNEKGARPEWECPIRDLKANEALILDFGPSVSVIRKDLMVAAEQAKNEFLASDRALLQAIDRLLRENSRKLDDLLAK